MKYKKGDLVRVIARIDGHGLEIGSVWPIHGTIEGRDTYLIKDLPDEHPWALCEAEVESACVSPES